MWPWFDWYRLLYDSLLTYVLRFFFLLWLFCHFALCPSLYLNVTDVLKNEESGQVEDNRRNVRPKTIHSRLSILMSCLLETSNKHDKERKKWHRTREMNHPSAHNLPDAKFSADNTLRITLFLVKYYIMSHAVSPLACLMNSVKEMGSNCVFVTVW